MVNLICSVGHWTAKTWCLLKFKPTSQHLTLHLCEPIIHLMGYNFALTNQLLSFRALQNVAMSPGVKRIFRLLIHTSYMQVLINSCPINLNLGWNVIANETPLDSWLLLLLPVLLEKHILTISSFTKLSGQLLTRNHDFNSSRVSQNHFYGYKFWKASEPD